MTNNHKHDNFKRLATMRGNRLLRDIKLIGNLSNTNNYDYSDEEIGRIFATIEEELKSAKARFLSRKKRMIKL